MSSLMDDIARTKYLLNNGAVINEDQRRIAQILHDYNPELEVRYIPPAMRTEGDTEPFCIIHNDSRNGNSYVVMYVSEEDFNHTVLAKIFMADQHRQDKNILSQIDATNAAIELLQQKRWEEKREEMRDFAFTVLRSPLHTFHHNGRTYS